MIHFATFPERPFAEVSVDAAELKTDHAPQDQHVSCYELDDDWDSIARWRRWETRLKRDSLPSPFLDDIKLLLQVLAIMSIPFFLILSCCLHSGLKLF
jgi:hypothetical protein